MASDNGNSTAKAVPVYPHEGKFSIVVTSNENATHVGVIGASLSNNPIAYRVVMEEVTLKEAKELSMLPKTDPKYKELTTS